LTPTAVLVDPHPLWLDGLESALRRVDIKTAAKTRSLDGGSMLVSEVLPDLVIAETTIDGDVDSGLQWVAAATFSSPETKIVVLSENSETGHIEDTLTAGAEAYVLKRTHVEDLVSAVKQLFNRSVFLRGETSVRQSFAMSTTPDALPLTRRELDILRLAAEGHSNVRIARILWITEQTVKFHLSNVYRKIAVSNRTEASRWAELHGLLGTQVA
jgi:DNA-binding NarL/FixJ family response regulator